MSGHQHARDTFAAMLVAQADLRSAVVAHARARGADALRSGARVRGYQQAWEVAARAAMDAVGLEPQDVYDQADLLLHRRIRMRDL